MLLVHVSCNSCILVQPWNVCSHTSVSTCDYVQYVMCKIMIWYVLYMYTCRLNINQLKPIVTLLYPLGAWWRANLKWSTYVLKAVHFIRVAKFETPLICVPSEVHLIYNNTARSNFSSCSSECGPAFVLCIPFQMATVIIADSIWINAVYRVYINTSLTS